MRVFAVLPNMDSNNFVSERLHRSGAAHRIRLRIAASLAVASLSVLGFSACAPAPEPKATSAGVQGLPLVDGKIVGKTDTSKRDGFRVVVKSNAADLIKGATSKLKGAGYTVHQSSKDSLGAVSERFFVSVSVATGTATYVFVARK